MIDHGYFQAPVDFWLENAINNITDIYNDYWIIVGSYCNMLSKSDYNAEVALEIRRKGNVFRKVFDMGCSKASGDFRSAYPYLIVPPNSDIRLRSVSSNVNTTVAGGIFGILAKIV